MVVYIRDKNVSGGILGNARRRDACRRRRGTITGECGTARDGCHITNLQVAQRNGVDKKCDLSEPTPVLQRECCTATGKWRRGERHRLCIHVRDRFLRNHKIADNQQRAGSKVLSAEGNLCSTLHAHLSRCNACDLRLAVPDLLGASVRNDDAPCS